MISFIASMPLETTDKEFIIDLYEEFKNLMFYTAQKYISTPNVAEDLVQDSIVKLIEKIDVLRPMSKQTLAGYIVVTIRNTSINYLKKQASDNTYCVDGQDPIFENTDNHIFSLDELLLLRERNAQLEKIWPKLSTNDRFLLEGKYILGYNDSELAAPLGCKSASIRMKLTRARRNALILLMENEEACSNDKA